MKVNRKEIEWFLTNIRKKESKKGIPFSDEELANEISNWIEINPGCIDIDGASHEGRYSYHTVGYGVFSLLGERYRMGRIEIFDKEEESGYQVSEGTFCMPFVAANQFEDFIRSIRTDFPINIEIGSMEWCRNSVSEDLGIPADKLNDPETKKKYYRDKFIKEYGYTPEEGEKRMIERFKNKNKE